MLCIVFTASTRPITKVLGIYSLSLPTLQESSILSIISVKLQEATITFISSFVRFSFRQFQVHTTQVIEFILSFVPFFHPYSIVYNCSSNSSIVSAILV
ncbi:MAG: hypothetical protein LBU14_00095 [Candidatus Peribacteria bacterium]|nr:hypothetical protein [Candidatus Peribacteria bacterium]